MADRWVTMAEFARMCGVSRQHIGQEAKRGNLVVNGTRVDTTTPRARLMLEGGKTKDEKQQERAERRATLELEKLKQQGLNLDIKNRQMRGKLRDARLQDAAFAELLQAALDRMRAGATSELNDVINAAIAEGFDSRAASEARIHKAMEDAAEDIKRQWDALVRSWESTAVVMSAADKLDP